MPDPIGARRPFQEGSDVAIHGPHVQLRGLVCNRSCRLDGPIQQSQVGDRIAGHLGRRVPGGPGRLPQVDEGLLVVQAFAFHQVALGLALPASMS